MAPNKITASYLGYLQSVYHDISKRGIMVDTNRISIAARKVDESIKCNLDIIKGIWNCHVYLGASNDDGSDSSVNLNASSGKRTPLLKFKSLGYDIPTVAKRNEDGEYESKESLAELALQKMLAQNQFNILGGDPAIKALLEIRELQTLKSRYINARLYNYEGKSYFLSRYNVAGTNTGRRASRKHTFGFGNNAQNIPKHGKLAEIYRRCLVAAPNSILLMVDQIQAEDWAVQALAEDHVGFQELLDSKDRHKKMACQVFRMNEDHYDAQGWKDSMERYLGKKIRHANNYDMRGPTMSDSLAKEGISMTPKHCQGLLDIANAANPNIKGVFHANIRKELSETRMLRTPFGREHQFFGLRPGAESSNSKIYREAYAFIPQSTIGDNTGFAVFDLESDLSRLPESIIQENHDSIVQQIPDNVDTLWNYTQRTIKAFDREIRFPNGFSFTIPVEGEIAYDFWNTVTLKNYETGSKKLVDLRYKDIQIAFNKLQEIAEREREKDAKEISLVGTGLCEVC